MLRQDPSEILRLTPATLNADLAVLFEEFDQSYSGGVCKYSGNGISCSTNLTEYHEIVSSALASIGPTPRQACRIIVAQAGTLALPTLQWNQRYFQEREIEACLVQTQYRLHHMPDQGFWQVYDRKNNLGIQLMCEPNGYPDWDPGSPLRNFIHWHRVSKNSGLVHAGTLAVDGVGVMLVGPGGSGKSGTVLAGLAQGLTTVGDDYVFADSDQGLVHASPLFNTLKQDPDGIRRLGLHTKSTIPNDVNWQGKHQFSVSDINPESMVDGIEIRALCLPHISGRGTTAFRKATAKEAFLALAPSGVSQIPGDRDLSFAHCAKLTRILPCYHVDLGIDPIEIAQQLRSFITKELR